MLAIAEFSRNTSHSTSHAEWGIVLLSGGYVSFSPKSFGIYLWHAIHNCIGYKWNWRSGGSCFFIFALSHSLFHCWIKNQHHLYHLCFEHSLFHCCLMLTQMHRWGLLKVSVTAHIIPSCDFASVNFIFSICRFFFSFVWVLYSPARLWGGSTSVCFDFATPALFPP